MRDVSVQVDEVMLKFGWYAAQSAGQEHEVVHDMADEIVRLREALAAATRVTEEMVERAARVWFTDPMVTFDSCSDFVQNWHREQARLALAAALEGPRD